MYHQPRQVSHFLNYEFIVATTTNIQYRKHYNNDNTEEAWCKARANHMISQLENIQIQRASHQVSPMTWFPTWVWYWRVTCLSLMGEKVSWAAQRHHSGLLSQMTAILSEVRAIHSHLISIDYISNCWKPLLRLSGSRGTPSLTITTQLNGIRNWQKLPHAFRYAGIVM